MEDALNIYERPLSVSQPVVCVDEKLVVLHEDTRSSPSIPLQPDELRGSYCFQRSIQKLDGLQLSDEPAPPQVLGITTKLAYTEVALDSPHAPYAPNPNHRSRAGCTFCSLR
jgi:hypothetical protein